MSTCAASSRDRAEPLAGTAAVARTWLLIEQPGPWGSKALTQSHFPSTLGRELEARAEGTGVRVALIRRPGPHADRRDPLPRRIFAAHTLPGRSWVRTAVITRASALAVLDLQRLGAGQHDGLGEPHEGDPLTLVCTNGKRDRCCAVEGRPLAAQLATAGSAEVWEVTHLGGHRFSPTLLILPHGYAYGRMTAPAATVAAGEIRQGLVETDGCRGRSCWDRPGQAAELALRRLTGETAADALHVTGTDPEGGATPGWRVTVAHRDGRRWQVRVGEGLTPEPLPASCGAPALPQSRMDAGSIIPLRPTASAGPRPREAVPAGSAGIG
ncbi:sucrase ferredoxin [Streptomyces sp. ACA25]|uniref:sucrase ferredoxin n=1 Tax=Streptomyces sp. ACA25 TaxID=3022596 RepID=UPI002306F556|nr:sucrase ferredoxin [Streptomyces sp. ACA25]MDB1088817.1 sucrase ferredoxin [Streptomyces sp. ACA25]